MSMTACSLTSPKQIDVTAKPIQKPTLALPPVDELNLRSVRWIVINKDNVDEVLAELEKNGTPIGLYVLTGEGYENLSLNFSDIRALIQQQNAIIAAYENYYTESEKIINDHNKSVTE